ncbi:MAG: DinB family protein [Thermoanaerobaculia bacterium]|nr:DinB family protein [Thermoanaerobaculia bacterium]
MSALFATGEPFSAAEIVAAMTRLHAESETYLAAIPAAEFAAPQGEKWSPADHVRHLAKSTYPLVGALGLPKLLLGLRFGRSRTGSRSLLEIREIYRATLRETGATAGRFAPSAQAAPADPAAWQQEVLAKWRGAVSGLALRIPRWSEPALDRYRLPHPLLGQLTVREMLLFTVYHNVHHLEQVAGRR